MPTGLLTISQYTPEPPIQVPVTSVLEVRGWYSRNFIAGDGVTPVLGNSSNGQQGPYYDIAATLNADGEVVVPAHEIQATTLSNPTASYFEGLWVDGAFVRYLLPNTQGASGWAIPTIYGDPIAYDEIATYNRAKRLLYPPDTYFTADQVIAEILRLSGNFNYMAVGVNGIGQASFPPVVASAPQVLMANDPRVGDWFNIEAYSAAAGNTAAQNATFIAAAVVAAAAAGGGIYIPLGTFSTNSVTISVPVMFAPGASILSPATGQTVTITKSIEGNPQQHFDNATAGLGTISLTGNVTVTEVWAAWWGALPSATAAVNAAALNAANVALVTIGSGEILLGPGTYDWNAEVVIGTTGTFTGISLRGTNGLVGTKLNWTGSTSGVGIHLKLGRYNRVHDLMINNAVAKGTTIGLEVDGNPGGAGGQTFFADFQRVTVRGFHVNLQVGIDSDTSTADLLTFQNVALEEGDVGFKGQGLGGLTNLTFTNVNVAGNATYGVWLTNTSCQVNWFGGAFGSNGISFQSDSTASLNLFGIRDEYVAPDWQFLVASSGQNSSNIRISNLVPAPINSTALTNPAITVYVGTVEIDHSYFGSTTNLVIPFGTTTTSGIGNGSQLSLNLHDNIINENVALFQYNSTTQSAFDGFKYRLWNNQKFNNAGNPSGRFEDEDGQIVWPGKLSKETLLQSTLAVNMNTATATTLFTAPTGRTCVITKVVVRNASTSLTTASYSFGWTTAAWSDVIANATHTELTGSTLSTTIFPKVGQRVGASAGTFKVLMNTLQGGAATTTMDVYGYYAS